MRSNFMSYEDWELIHEERVKCERKRKLTVLKQKLFGLLLVTIGIVCPILLDGDLTESVFCLPVGLYLIGCQTVIR